MKKNRIFFNYYIFTLGIVGLIAGAVLFFSSLSFSQWNIDKSLIWLNDIYPYSIALLAFLFLPVMIYYSCQIIYFDHRQRTAYQEKLLSEKKKVSFSARYRQHNVQSGKTEWEVKNTSDFLWKDGRFFIECLLKKKKETKIYPIENIGPNQTVLIESDLPYDCQARWRTMIVTPNGYSIDLADHWQ